jgi:DNA primase
MSRPGYAKNRLPSPADYFGRFGPKLSGRGTWRDAVCPFHQDSRPSLRINVECGHWRCMACGARGGDVLAFHRLRTGKGFVESARELGAWNER